jgi:hypothetical protein
MITLRSLCGMSHLLPAPRGTFRHSNYLAVPVSTLTGRITNAFLGLARALRFCAAQRRQGLSSLTRGLLPLYVVLRTGLQQIGR